MKKTIIAVILLLLLPTYALAGTYDAIMDTGGDAGKLTVRFPDLDSISGDKAGDCAILSSPDGKIMVIDAGAPDAADDVLRALDAMGVSTIDYLVASHPHIDHVGGMPQIIENYEVKNAYASFVEYDTIYTQAFKKALKNNSVPFTLLERGDTFLFGDEVTVRILHPGSDIVYYDKYPEGGTQFINDLSLVMLLEYKGTRMLFSGDLYSLGEKDVLLQNSDLKADLFKVNHHGADTSSGKAWRTAVAPKVAVITHNGIASARIPRKFSEEGADVYHTFVDGAIRVSSFGGGVLDVLTEEQNGF